MTRRSTRRAKPSPKRTRLSPEARREQLLEIAFNALLQGPLEDVTVDAVAEKAEVSRGLVFHYFPSVNALHLACIARAADALVDSVTFAVTSATEDEAVRAGIDAFVSFIEFQPMTYTAVSARAAADPEFGAILDDVRRQVVDLILRRPEAKDGALAPIFALGWVALVEVVVQQWVADRVVDREDLLDGLVDSAEALLSRRAPIDR